MHLLSTVCQLGLSSEVGQFISPEAVPEFAVLTTILHLLITRFFSPADLRLFNSAHSNRFAACSLGVKSGEIKTSFHCSVFLRLNDLLKIVYFTLIESKVMSKGWIFLSCFLPKQYSLVTPAPSSLIKIVTPCFNRHIALILRRSLSVQLQ